MATPDILISYGGDGKSKEVLRKEIIKSLKNLSIGLSDASIAEGKKKIQSSFEKSPPKISIDVNMTSLRSAKSKIQAGLSDVKIKLKINPSDVRAEKNKIQALLGNFSIGFKDPRLLQNLQNTIKGISDVKFTLNRQSLNNFLSQAQAALNRNPLQANVVIPAKTSNLLNRAARQTSTQAKTTAPSSGKNRKQEIDELTTFGERIGFTTSRLVAYTIAAGALYRTIQGVRSAADSIKDIDVAINRLTQILDGNVQRASNLASSVIAIAERFGQSGKQILGIADEFAQTGGVFNTDQSILSAVNAIARTPLLATFTNIEETVNGSIAAINQFNLTAQDTVRIIDIANEVSKKFAFQSQDLFTAVSRGGSSFKLVGGDIEDFTAFVAAAKELTLLPATTIGTGANTISLKLLQTENINFLDDLTKGKIRDAEGNLKGINEILIETGRALRGLSKQETAGIFTQLFDIRQTKIGGPLLQDIRDSADGESRLEQIRRVALEASGSSARDAAFGIERIDAILGSIGARFDKVFKSFAEDSRIKNLVKDFASLAKSFADTVGVLQPLIPSLVRVGAAFAAISLIRNTPGFFRGAQNVKPGPFNPLSPSSITGSGPTFQKRTTNNQTGFRLISDGSSVGTKVIPSSKNTVSGVGNVLTPPGALQGIFNQTRLRKSQFGSIKNKLTSRSAYIASYLGENIGSLKLEQDRIRQNLNDRRNNAIAERDRMSRLSQKAQGQIDFFNERQNAPIPKNMFAAIQNAEDIASLKPIAERAQQRLNKYNLLQKAYNDIIRSTTSSLKQKTIATAESTRLQKSINIQEAELSNIRRRQSRIVQPTLLGGIGQSVFRTGQNFKKGVTRNSELIAGLGVGVIADTIIQSVRGNIDQPRSFFGSNGRLTGNLNETLDKNNNINKQQNILSGAGNFASIGSIIGAAIGTAILPGIGSVIGASVGAGGGAGIGAGIGALTSKNITNEQLLSLVGQAREGKDRNKVIGEFFKRNEIKLEATGLVRSGRDERGNITTSSVLALRGEKEFKDSIKSEGGLDFREAIFGEIANVGSELTFKEDLPSDIKNMAMSLATGKKYQDEYTKQLKNLVIKKILEKFPASVEQATLIFDEFAPQIVELNKESKKLSDVFKLAAENIRKNFADFVVDFNKSSQNISDESSIGLSNINRRENVFTSITGGNAQADLIPAGFAEIFARKLTDELSTTDLNSVKSSVGRNLSGIATSDEANTIGDFLTVKKLVENSSLKIRTGLSAIPEDANPGSVSAAIESIIKDVFPPEIIKEFSKIPEGREFFSTVRANLNAVGKDPNVTSKSGEEITKAVLGSFSDLAFVTNRITALIEKENIRRQEVVSLYEKEAFVLSERFKIGQQAVGFNIGNVSRRRAIGESRSESINFLKSLLSNADPSLAAKNLGASSQNLRLSQQRLNRNGSTLTNSFLNESVNSELINNKEANRLFQESLQNSATDLQILNNIFDELTNSIRDTIEANKKIGLTDIPERLTGERDLSIVEQQIGGLFGKGGLLSNINSPEGLVRTFGNKLPQIASSINQQFGNNSTFLRSAQGASSLFGGTSLSGGNGQTVGEAIDLVGVLSGLGRIDPKTGRQLELEKLLSLGQEQLKVFFDGRTIEQKQLDALTTINATLIQGFNLPNVPVAPPKIETPSSAPQVPQSNQTKNEPAFDKSRVDKLIEGTAEVLSFTRELNKRSPESKESIDSLRDVLKEVLADAGSAKRGKNESKIDFKSDINIQGFENIGKDKATALITIEILNKFVEKLQGGTPSEMDLASKLLLAIKEIQNGMKNK
jgi:TP901 family phage tail tape measure protein